MMEVLPLVVVSSSVNHERLWSIYPIFSSLVFRQAYYWAHASQSLLKVISFILEHIPLNEWIPWSWETIQGGHNILSFFYPFFTCFELFLDLRNHREVGLCGLWILWWASSLLLWWWSSFFLWFILVWTLRDWYSIYPIFSSLVMICDFPCVNSSQGLLKVIKVLLEHITWMNESHDLGRPFKVVITISYSSTFSSTTLSCSLIWSC